MKFAALLVKNLLRNRRRTALTIVSIAVSLFVFAALMSLPTVARSILADSASSVRVVVHNKAGLPYGLPLAYKQRIATMPHVEAVAAQSWFGGIYHDVTDQFPNFAIDHEEFEAIFSDWGVSPGGVREFKARRTAALVGRATMQRFGWKVGDQVSLRGTLYPFNLTFDIVGTIDRNAPPNVLIFRRDYLEEAAGRPGFVSLYWVRTDDSAAVPQVIAAIDEAFANSSAETQSQSEAAFIGGFLENYRTIFLIAELLGVIVVLTIALVAANTAAMSIRERRAEIAVMRAMGFPASTVLGLLLAESITISLVGGALGCGAAWAAMRMFSVGAPAMGPLSTVRVPAEVVLIGLAIAALIGIFSALIPARSAARRNIVDTLRAVA